MAMVKLVMTRARRKTRVSRVKARVTNFFILVPLWFGFCGWCRIGEGCGIMVLLHLEGKKHEVQDRNRTGS